MARINTNHLGATRPDVTQNMDINAVALKLPCKSEVLLHTAFSGVEPLKVSGRTDYAAFTPLWGCRAMSLAWRFSFTADELINYMFEEE